MTALADMSVTEAVSKTFELMIYGEWDNQKGYSWRTAREGSFEDYLKSYVSAEYDGDDFYDSEKDEYVPVSELKNLDHDRIWQRFHGGGNKGVRDGWTGEVVTSYGGEGEGEQYWMVISISAGTTTRYFRKDGWYASYDGGYLDGETYEVTPQERLVTFYE